MEVTTFANLSRPHKLMAFFNRQKKEENPLVTWGDVEKLTDEQMVEIWEMWG